MDNIYKKGYTIIQPEGTTPEHVAALRAEFITTIRAFPEFRRDAEKFVMGSFAALGNPSSFHNEFVRRVRKAAHAEVLPHLRQLAKSALQWTEKPEDTLNVELLIDRMLFRPAGTKIASESWHRDTSPAAHVDDIILGGWMNFDPEPQQFICVPGSHDDRSINRTGFDKITDPAKIAEYKAAQTTVLIPPGAILLFDQTIVHRVAPSTTASESCRLFLGWRLTREKEPLTKVGSLLDAQAVIPIKSGQTPTMHARLHWANWRGKLDKFSKRNINPLCLVNRRVSSGIEKDRVYRVVPEVMDSLRAYANAHPAAFKLYPQYTGPEKDLCYPHKLK